MARILIVDDDADILRLVERVLKMSGHDVFTACDAMKAMDLLNVSVYDLLISDANMPRFSGFELIRTVKNNKKFSRMAIAMLTGLREKKDIEKAIRVGIDDYIVKPIEPALLVQKVDALFHKKPPMEKLEIDLPETTSYAKAEMGVSSQIIRVSDTDLTLKTNIEFLEGMNVQLQTDLFKKIDTVIPPMRVISCRKIVEFEYEVKLAYVVVNDSFQYKIRAWMHLQSSKKKVAA
jgi:DNA-binding response OmpR family regulator